MHAAKPYNILLSIKNRSAIYVNYFPILAKRSVSILKDESLKLHGTVNKTIIQNYQHCHAHLPQITSTCHKQPIRQKSQKPSMYSLYCRLYRFRLWLQLRRTQCIQPKETEKKLWNEYQCQVMFSFSLLMKTQNFHMRKTCNKTL